VVSKQKSKVERPPLDPEYSVKEVAASMGVDIDFVYDEIARGNLVATRYNCRVIRVPLSALDAYRSARQSVYAGSQAKWV
jgi:excisionase family DNA binding protein